MNLPQQYSRNLAPFVNIARHLFEKHGNLLKWNSEPESILDIGIGDGTITKEVIMPRIPSNVKEYIGADISEAMLKSTKETVRFNQFTTMQMDVATKDLPDQMRNRFHHVFSSYLFHHVQDMR